MFHRLNSYLRSWRRRFSTTCAIENNYDLRSDLRFFSYLRTAVPWQELHEYDAVGRHFGLEVVGSFHQVLLLPKVAYRLFAAQSQLAERNAHLRRLRILVEEADGHRTILKVFGIDYLLVFLPDGVSLYAQRVLVDVVDFIVGEQAHREIIHLCDVATDEHRRGE